MINKTDLLNSVIERAQKTLGSSPLTGAGQDIKKNIHAVILNTLNKMDLVTRDDFEAQQAVLRHTRGKLEALEEKVVLLEQQITTTEKT